MANCKKTDFPPAHGIQNPEGGINTTSLRTSLHMTADMSLTFLAMASQELSGFLSPPVTPI
jgi:hypothetical protein